MPDLSALIERLEKASGELDIDTLGQVICAGYGVEFRRATRGMGDDGSEELSVYAKDQQFEVWGDYRSRAPDVSIDTALAFVERVLPGVMWRIGFDPDYGVMKAELVTAAPNCINKSARHEKVPLAILIAALKALQERGGEHG